MTKTARVLFYCLIVWAPLPFGSNRPFVWVINGIVAATILALFLVGEFTSGRRISVDMRPATAPVIGITIWSVWMVIQTLPGLPAILNHPIWTTIGADLPGTVGAISIAPASTWTAIAQVVPVVFLSMFAMRLAFNRRRGLLLLKLVAVTSVAVAAYGMLAQYVGFRQILLLASETDDEVLTGTFVGRNAAATYFAVGLACSTSLLLTHIEFAFRRGHGPRPSFSDAADTLRWAAIWLLACLFLVVAILETGSRGGATVGLISLLSVTLFWMWRASVGWRTLMGVLVVVALAVAVATIASSGILLDRLEVGVGNGDRFLAYRDTIDMILARPILGHGAGTFVDAYPLFHGRSLPAAVWNAAHNSYLQAAAELGLPVFFILALTVGSAVVFIVRRVVRRTEPAPVAIAAIGVMAAVGVHAMVDFSLQFQAIGLTVAALIGAGLGDAMVLSYEARPTTQPVRAAVPLSLATASTAPPVTTYVRFARTEPASNPTFPSEGISKTAPKSGALEVESEFSLQHDGADLQAALNGVPERLYVFGDVHGRLDLLTRLKAAIDRDRDSVAACPTVVVGLGDYIDRGRDSNGVIDALIAGFGCPSIILRGNHEQMLLDFMDKPTRMGRRWFEYGALETLNSYGVDMTLVTRPGIDFRMVRDRLAQAMPPSHIAFLRSTRTSFQTERYFFAHAGARPGRALEEQSVRDLLWIRKGFADCDSAFDKVIVHAHTPVDKPYFGKYRINLDTGAYVTNRLSCLVIEGDGHRLLEI
jgi:serine/threonine protein phosphatase 1